MRSRKKGKAKDTGEYFRRVLALLAHAFLTRVYGRGLNCVQLHVQQSMKPVSGPSCLVYFYHSRYDPASFLMGFLYHISHSLSLRVFDMMRGSGGGWDRLSQSLLSLRLVATGYLQPRISYIICSIVNLGRCTDILVPGFRRCLGLHTFVHPSHSRVVKCLSLAPRLTV